MTSEPEILADYLSKKRTRTNPDHKASFRVGVECICSCGWRSALWVNKGAKSEAAKEWRLHREHCETVDEIMKAETGR